MRYVGAQDLDWPFRGEPTFKTQGPGGHARSHPVDPFPCYSHDRQIAADVAAMVEMAFPIAYPVDYYLLEFEETGRTNGFADKVDVYDCNLAKYVHWEAGIVLIGKRIPPHPAMTRYLVAHEYGHAAQWWLEKLRGIDSNKSTTDLDLEYMRLRPGSNNDYGARRWHANVGELIANDFRIAVCGVEEEFWPHSNFPHTREVPDVLEFWEKAVAEAQNGCLQREISDALEK